MSSAMDKIRDPDAPGSRQEATSHLPTDDALDVSLFGVVSEQDIIVERDRLNTEKQEYEQYGFTDAEQLRERHLEDERYWDCWTVEILDLCLLEWSGPDECEWNTQEFFRRRIHAEYGLEYERRRNPHINLSKLAEWAYYWTNIPHGLLDVLFQYADDPRWVENCLEIVADHYAAQRRRNTPSNTGFSSVKQTHDFKKEGF